MCAAIFQIYMVVMFAALVVALSEEAYIFFAPRKFREISDADKSRVRIFCLCCEFLAPS